MPGNVRYDSYGGPSRAKSLDCLADKNSGTNEYVPSRISRLAPKANDAAMQFVKTGPANLYKTATEQIKKAEAVKALRKNLVVEEEEWQQNLDKWKSSRRKKNEEALERVIEIKKNEQEEEFAQTRRKSKTFSEMQEDKSKRGRRYNLVVHDDDNNDLGDLGLSSAKSTSSLTDVHDDNDVKDLDQDNKDAKSDAGFCTGSDTGSDGVFAEDNISDTSSALGDKKEAHDSLLDSGVTKDDEAHVNGHGSSLTTDILQNNSSNLSCDEYTYDKAIEGYKQYAENSAKRRTSSITSLNSNTSYTKEDDRREDKSWITTRSQSPSKSTKLEEKLSFFSKEMGKEFRKSPEPKVIKREKSPKVDIGKRRSMFEINESLAVTNTKEQKLVNRRSLDMSNTLRNRVASFENLEAEPTRARSITPSRDSSLRSKVASFENLDTQSTKVRGITPPRDVKFQEKLATFSAAEAESQPVQKKTPERDVNFHKKLASFTSIENGEEDKVKERKTIPTGDPLLKNKIASFKQLEQQVETPKLAPLEAVQKNREKSISLEYLDEPQTKEVMRPSVSVGNMGLLRRTPSTAFMVVDLEGSGVEEVCLRRSKPMVNSEQDTAKAQDPAKRSTVYETIEKYHVVRDVDSAPMYSIFQYLSPEVNEENSFENDPLYEPHYQTLEEVRGELRANAEEILTLPSAVPPTPMPIAPVETPQPPVIEAPEVLDVTWTDGPSQAAPPSEPPPPPPPDDESDEDASLQPQSLPAQEEDVAFTRENSTRRIKKELWRRRSDFLGTSSQYIEEEPAMKPPPDLSDFLRKECEVDRALLESQQSKISSSVILNEEEISRREREIIENLERSEQLKKDQQSRNMWNEYTHQEEDLSEDMSDVDEHMQYQKAKDQQTSSGSNLDAEVAMMVPEASPNNPESSHSVSETTDPEPKQMEYHNLENNPSTTFFSLKSSVQTEEIQAEVLESSVVESAVAVAHKSLVAAESLQFQAETECKLSPETSNQNYDHLVAYSGTLDYSSDSVASTSSLPDQYKKLAELEEEMMKHDKDMLQRAGKLSDSNSAQIPPPSPYAVQEESSPVSGSENNGYSYHSQPAACNLPIQEFYTAPTYESDPQGSFHPESTATTHASPGQNLVASPSVSPSQYSTLASPHPFHRSNSQMSLGGGAPIHTPLQGVKSSPMTLQKDPIPEPLPRKKKLPPPPPSKPQMADLNTVERLEAIRLSRMPTSDNNQEASDQTEPQGQSVSPSGQQMSKQTLLALSAIPKPRLIDNESWITKKKPDARRDYSKHWLHQEAEQRRLEQQDRISRFKPAVSPSQSTTSQTTSQPSSQQISPPHTTSFHPTHVPATFIPQNTTPTYSSYPQSLKNPSLSQNNISNNNNTNNSNSWRNQATTYQPLMPTPSSTGDKALPDSIIHNLTQRVNNKNNKNTYNNNNSNGRLGTYGNSNYRDENYHDYMNADALSAPPVHAPLYQSSTGPGQSSPSNTQQDISPSAQDQRLLSVSGKKKCSHCSEELGRGAAMIIESLRLFYHIPCFKCCVCGIQLGNGSSGADVRVRNHKLHCHNCYSNDEGMKFSKV